MHNSSEYTFHGLLVVASFFAMFKLSPHTSNFWGYWWSGEQISLRYSWSEMQPWTATLARVGTILTLIIIAVNVVIFIFSQLKKESKLSIPARSIKSVGSIIMGIAVAACVILSSFGFQGIWDARSEFPLAQPYYYKTQAMTLFNSYGLFRRMTGVGPIRRVSSEHYNAAVPTVQRPELIIEAYHPKTQKWIELDFIHKPGTIKKAPLWTIPHQPRVDWQMWFAALGNYQSSPFLVNLAHKLLISYDKNQGIPEINELFTNFEREFNLTSPSEVRVNMYNYDFTRWQLPWATLTNPFLTFVNSTHRGDEWWTRRTAKEYLPALGKDNPSLREFLEGHGIFSDRYVSLQSQIEICKGRSSPLDLNGFATIRELVNQLACDTLAARPLIELITKNRIVPIATLLAIILSS